MKIINRIYPNSKFDVERIDINRDTDKQTLNTIVPKVRKYIEDWL